MTVDHQGALAGVLRSILEGVDTFDNDVDALAVLDVDSCTVGAGEGKAVESHSGIGRTIEEERAFAGSTAEGVGHFVGESCGRSNLDLSARAFEGEAGIDVGGYGKFGSNACPVDLNGFRKAAALGNGEVGSVATSAASFFATTFFSAAFTAL